MRVFFSGTRNQGALLKQAPGAIFTPFMFKLQDKKSNANSKHWKPGTCVIMGTKMTAEVEVNKGC